MILGVLHHAGGNVQQVADLAELLGPDMLVGSISEPPPETDFFYNSCSFHVEARKADVVIAERGQHSTMKLRFLPDEEKENKIRGQTFSEVVSKKVGHALTTMQAREAEVTESVAAKRKRKEDRAAALQVQKESLTEDRPRVEGTCVKQLRFVAFVVAQAIPP